MAFSNLKKTTSKKNEVKCNLPHLHKPIIKNKNLIITNSTQVAIRQDFSLDFKLRKEPANHSSDSRALRDEKAQFIAMVWQTHLDAKVPEKVACQLISKYNLDDFPRLSCAGKNGTSALHYNNYRNWVNGSSSKPGIGRNLDHSPNLNNMDLLLTNYGKETLLYGDPCFWRALWSEYLRNSEAKISKIYRILQIKWQLETPEQLIPTLAQVFYNLKTQFPKRFKDYARKGENYYNQHYLNFISRDPNSIRPNEAWVADTQDCDFVIKVPKEQKDYEANLNDKSEWKVVRPKIVVMLDIKSEHVVSCQLIVQAATNENIRIALATGIASYGRPKIFYTDNGSDYCASGFTDPVVFVPKMDGSVIHEHSIIKELDIAHYRATKYNAKAKYVERFFKEMAEYARHARGYVGNCPQARPADANVWAKANNREYLMDLKEACDFVYSNIDLYHNTPKENSKYLNGLTPAQAFAPELRYTRPDLSNEEYIRAFRKPMPEARKVGGRGPSVQYNKKIFDAVPEEAYKLWPYDGKEVMVKFNMISDENCFVYDLNGAYICECRTKKMMPYFTSTDEDKEQLSAMLETIRKEKKYLNAMLMNATGGWHKVDAQTTFNLPREAFSSTPDLKLIDSRVAVKGDTHNPKIYIPKHEYEARIESKKELEVKPKLTTKEKKYPNLENDIERIILGENSKNKHYDLSNIENNKTTKKETILDENFI